MWWSSCMEQIHIRFTYHVTVSGIRSCHGKFIIKLKGRGHVDWGFHSSFTTRSSEIHRLTVTSTPTQSPQALTHDYNLLLHEDTWCVESMWISHSDTRPGSASLLVGAKWIFYFGKLMVLEVASGKATTCVAEALYLAYRLILGQQQKSDAV